MERRRIGERDGGVEEERDTHGGSMAVCSHCSACKEKEGRSDCLNAGLLEVVLACHLFARRKATVGYEP